MKLKLIVKATVVHLQTDDHYHIDDHYEVFKWVLAYE